MVLARKLWIWYLSKGQVLTSELRRSQLEVLVNLSVF